MSRLNTLLRRLSTTFRRSAGRRRALLCSLIGLALAAQVPAPTAASCGALNPWFQPTTVQRGDSLLVTGTGVPTGEGLVFTFTQQNTYPPNVRRYTTGAANGNCIVNQEYVDSFHFNKGTYDVVVESAQLDNLRGPGGNIESAVEYIPDVLVGLDTPLSVVMRTSPMPVPTPANCGQPAHAWFGPSPVGTHQLGYVAAIAYPNTMVDFYLEGLGVLQKVVRIGPAHSNCVVEQQYIYFTGSGQLPVHAGFWDETGHYNYVDLGSWTVN